MAIVSLTSLRLLKKTHFLVSFIPDKSIDRFCSSPLAMDEVFEPVTFDIQVDDFVKAKAVSRCKDEFVNVLCEDNDDEPVEDSDEDEIVYSIHNPKVKWNVMKPIIGERALSLIDGKLSDHYARVWDYGHELMRSNPGSTVRISVNINPDQTTTFHRVYVCFKAIKDGWKIGFRRVIGLDGFFFEGSMQWKVYNGSGGRGKRGRGIGCGLKGNTKFGEGNTNLDEENVVTPTAESDNEEARDVESPKFDD
ncbi:unnamed protein product [Lactuca saligna]|uniref:Uncharacterized protein n=1 Tax=Lactuca saligna TaxID=75948 RepID=A0AA35YUU5_LACSI|nr:unnamed protein product [Lactuca saligna]